jgi:hypothetical protein
VPEKHLVLQIEEHLLGQPELPGHLLVPPVAEETLELPVTVGQRVAVSPAIDDRAVDGGDVVGVSRAAEPPPPPREKVKAKMMTAKIA